MEFLHLQSTADTVMRNKQRSNVWKKLFKLLSPAVTIIGLIVILVSAFAKSFTFFEASLLSNVVRVAYTALTSISMEYISRYIHSQLWHSKYLWWIHGSHHNQYPVMGSVPTYNRKNQYVSPTIESNDFMAVIFALIAASLMWVGSEYPSAYAADCALGTGLGVTIYGFSYFLGHDIGAHERLGKRFAHALRAIPYLDDCARTHMNYHHKLTKQNNDRDPYGPPYGFWLGPFEVACLKQGKECAPMPVFIKRLLWSAIFIPLAITVLNMSKGGGFIAMCLGVSLWQYCVMNESSSSLTNTRICHQRFRKFAALNWSTPKALPHGFSGFISIAFGLYLIFCHSLVGDLRPFLIVPNDETHTPYLVLTYVISTMWNALAGMKIASSAPPNSRTVFRRCAILQVCLSYFTLRFMPHSSKLLVMYQESLGVSTSMVWLVDAIVTILSLRSTISFFSVVNDTFKKSIILSQAIAFGIFAILLLSVYPVQLSIQGEEWWSCIQNRYPLQAAGMVAYIYIPATVTFSLIIFGATLFHRNILSSSEYAIASLLVITICLLSTVLSQELHIPYLSTQRIYLPCIDPLVPDSFEGRLVEGLDFSRYAQYILRLFFDVNSVPLRAM